MRISTGPPSRRVGLPTSPLTSSQRRAAGSVEATTCPVELQASPQPALVPNPTRIAREGHEIALTDSFGATPLR